MASPDFATVAPRTSASPTHDLESKLTRLAKKKHEWPTVGTRERARLLDRCIQTTLRTAKEWVRAACEAKGIPFDAPVAGEEWLSGPVNVVRNLRLLREAMIADGQPELPGVRQGATGQKIVDVFPQSLLDRVLYAGVRAEVWIEPGQPASQGQVYRQKKRHAPGPRDGKLALVLGAGNIASIGPMDALYKLFVEDEVVLVKTNPVNAYLQPFWEESLRPLVDAGYFAVVRGGPDIGKFLCAHPSVDTLHITGSDRTHDAIVWGADPATQAANKAAGRPVLDKPITSELGAVTPCLVVPGEWTDSQLRFQARHVASMVAHNASFNCNACKVLVTAKGWSQREEFLRRVEEALTAMNQRRAYYPGAQERYQSFLSRYPGARALGAPRAGDVVPWTLLPNVPATAGEYALSTEAFCGVLAETTLDVRTADEFLNAAVPFANDHVWGTLSCMILIDEKTRTRHASALARAIAELRYGGIAVNAWAGLIYGLVTPSWGAFPGHPLNDIRSGRGVVHNALLLDHPEKSVVYAPFTPALGTRPTPVWFTDHKTAHLVGQHVLEVEAKPELPTVAKLIAAAFRG